MPHGAYGRQYRGPNSSFESFPGTDGPATVALLIESATPKSGGMCRASDTLPPIFSQAAAVRMKNSARSGHWLAGSWPRYGAAARVHEIVLRQARRVQLHPSLAAVWYLAAVVNAYLLRHGSGGAVLPRSVAGYSAMSQRRLPEPFSGGPVLEVARPPGRGRVAAQPDQVLRRLCSPAMIAVVEEHRGAPCQPVHAQVSVVHQLGGPQL